MRFSLAMVQMSVTGGDKERNLAHAGDCVAEAAAHGCEVVLLPETMDLGWTHPASLTDAESIPGGQPYRMLSDMAKKHGVFLCAGLTEKCGSLVFNAAVLIGKNGELLCLHRKLNELDIGHEFYAQGDRLGVVHTELGTFGVMVCADGLARGQVLSRSLCYMGADVILAPSAWAVPPDHDNASNPYGEEWRAAFKPVARDFSVWIAAVSNVGLMDAGPWNGRKCIGCSLVIDPEGKEAAIGPYGEEAETNLYLDVEPKVRPARGCGWTDHWRSQGQA